MTQAATITSKRQLTIPVGIFKKVGFSYGQKVLISEEKGKVVIVPFTDLIEKLAGSLEIPRRWKGKKPETIIEESKMEYFDKQFKR